MQLCNEMQFLYELNELACEEDLLFCNPIEERDPACTFKEGMLIRKKNETGVMKLACSFGLNLIFISQFA